MKLKMNASFVISRALHVVEEETKIVYLANKTYFCFVLNSEVDCFLCGLIFYLDAGFLLYFHAVVSYCNTIYYTNIQFFPIKNIYILLHKINPHPSSINRLAWVSQDRPPPRYFLLSSPTI